MKVLVVNNAAPFIRGGAEELADRLVRELNATSGIEAELLRIPFRWEPAECIADQNSAQFKFAPLSSRPSYCSEISGLSYSA